MTAPEELTTNTELALFDRMVTLFSDHTGTDASKWTQLEREWLKITKLMADRVLDNNPELRKVHV